jgi:hypothetical protein
VENLDLVAAALAFLAVSCGWAAVATGAIADVVLDAR